MPPILIQVFLSSPGDVAVERGIAREILDQLQTDPLIRDEIELKIVAWDDPHSRTYMPLTLTPQQAIDLGLPRPADCTIFVMLLWGRMGTPLAVDKHGTKPTGEQYWSGTEWEYLDALAANEQHGTLPFIYLYHRTDDPTPPQAKDFKDRQEYFEALEDFPAQLKRVDQFLKQFRGAGGTYLGNVHSYDTPDKFKELFEQDARILVRKAYDLLTGKTSAPPPKKAPDWTGSPFPGLRAFTPADEPIYFGRGRETADLVKRLSSTPFVAVVGASGSGKSSLVGAGLIPQLKRNAIAGSSEWLVIHFTPSDKPFLRLAEALIHNIPTLSNKSTLYANRARKLAYFLEQSPKALEDVAQRILVINNQKWTTIALLVDQFEELLTLVPYDQQYAFAKLLTYEASSLRIVLTLRADFYHKAVEIAPLAEKLRDGLFPLSRPSVINLYDMIAKPAQRAGLHFEEGLIEQIVEDTGEDAGALALMAYALDELYHACKDKQHITFEDYSNIGGVQGAIGKRAEQIFEKMQGSEDEKQKLIERLFTKLVTVDNHKVPTRQRINYYPEDTTNAENKLVESLTEVRLLVKGSDSHGITVEVAHEALLKKWERLALWIQESIQLIQFSSDLLRQAQLWEEHDHDMSYLYTGTPLQYAIENREKLYLTTLQSDFLFTSEQKRDSEKKKAANEEELLVDLQTAREQLQRYADDLQALYTDGREKRGELAMVYERLKSVEEELAQCRQQIG